MERRNCEEKYKYLGIYRILEPVNYLHSFTILSKNIVLNLPD